MEPEEAETLIQKALAEREKRRKYQRDYYVRHREDRLEYARKYQSARRDRLLAALKVRGCDEMWGCTLDSCGPRCGCKPCLEAKYGPMPTDE